MSLRARLAAGWRQLTSPAPNAVHTVDAARAHLDSGALDDLLADEGQEVRAVKELRTQVRGLGLREAVELVREAKRRRA